MNRLRSQELHVQYDIVEAFTRGAEINEQFRDHVDRHAMLVLKCQSCGNRWSATAPGKPTH